MLIENDKIILIFSTRPKPWPWLLIQAFAVVRLIPRCRRFRHRSSW